MPTEMELTLEQTQQGVCHEVSVLPTIGAVDSRRLKNFKKYATLKLFKSTNQERYEHVSPEVTSSQDGKSYKMAKRDYAWLMISRLLVFYSGNYEVIDLSEEPGNEAVPGLVEQDKALEQNPNDKELIQLRDLLDVLFGSRTYYQPSKDSPKENEGQLKDILFMTDYVNEPRGVLETLCPGIKKSSAVIDIFTKVQNHAKLYRDPLKPMRKVFFETSMMHEWDVKDSSAKEDDDKEAADKFNENMLCILRTTSYRNLSNVDLVIFLLVTSNYLE
ncbi:hypothetical protein Tco_0564184 [Tanacetum coccineum]